LNDFDWDKEEFKSEKYFSYSKRSEKATSSPDTKKEEEDYYDNDNDEIETNFNYYSNEFLNKRRK
jgi:hypothetical protein